MWAILDAAVGLFGPCNGPLLDILKIYGPFWSGKFWFMGRFGGTPMYKIPQDFLLTTCY